MSELDRLATRYEESERAQRYRGRSPSRERAERRLVTRLLRGLDLGLVLDVPCGGGRFADLVESLGGTWVGADRALPMLAGGRGPRVRASIGALPFADRSFETVFCFRFLHHVAPEQQAALVAELARVAGRRLVISGFHPFSWHRLERACLGRLLGRRGARHPTDPRSIDRWLGGFRRLACLRQGWGRDLWIGCWERQRGHPVGEKG